MATEKKAAKKSKLRHAEYYDLQKTQDKLYADSLAGKEFQNLIQLIAMPENIRMAYRNIKSNDGSKTPGTDGRTIRDLEKLSDEKLISLVQQKLAWYQPEGWKPGKDAAAWYPNNFRPPDSAMCIAGTGADL